MPTMNSDFRLLTSEAVHVPGRRAASHDFKQSSDITRDRLYQEFAPLVRRLIRQYGTDADLRQDLAGEIYCCFCHLVDAYDPERGIPLHPYIVRQLTAAVYTYARQQWHLRKREIIIDPLYSGELSPPVDPTPSWLQAFCDKQMMVSLPKVITKLPQRQRQVVVWRYYEDRSFEEIADLLQIQTSTARSLLRHGLNNLRRALLQTPCVNAQ